MSVSDCVRYADMVPEYKKFDICMVELSEPEFGSYVQGGYRPAVIVSNDMCNRFSQVITVVPLTSQRKKYLPTHVNLCGFGLRGPGIALCEQVTAVDKKEITKKIGYIYDKGVQNAINRAVCTQIAL